MALSLRTTFRRTTTKAVVTRQHQKRHYDVRRVVTLAEQEVPVISMKTLTSTLASPLEAAPFLHQVLPPLMARMANSMDEAPTALRSMPAIDALRVWYAESALAIAELDAPPSGGQTNWRTRPSKTFMARELRFGEMLESIRSRGREVRDSLVLATSATGGLWGSNREAARDIDDFLIEFYTKRLTLRLLLGQYATCRRQLEQEYCASTFESLDLNNDGQLDADEFARARALYGRDEPFKGAADVSKPTVCGLVDEEMNPFDVAVQAVADVQAECRMSRFRKAPPFTMHGRGQGNTMAYLPRHLYKILRDILRNAAKATLLKAAAYENDDEMPPIAVVIADDTSNDDLTIKISDEAGGIPRSKVRNIFSFATSGTVFSEKDLTSVLADQAICRALGKPEPSLLSDAALSEDVAAVTAQRAVGTAAVGGHGLPISRVYARYFHGDLRVRSMDGYGTDAYCYISRIADNVLPT